MNSASKHFKIVFLFAYLNLAIEKTKGYLSFEGLSSHLGSFEKMDQLAIPHNKWILENTSNQSLPIDFQGLY